MDHRKLASAIALAAAAVTALAEDVKPTTYASGQGFTFQTADDSFKLSLGGRLQAQYVYTGVDNQPERVGFTQDSSSFKIKRAYAWLKGNAFTKDLTYVVQADLSTSPQLLEALANYRFMDELQVEVGQDVVQFTRQERNSSATLQFVERSIAVDYYKPSYDTGVMVWGKIAGGLAYYNVGAFNGQGLNQTRSTPNAAFNFRAVVNPLGDVPYAEGDVDLTQSPKLSIGASYFMNKLVYGAGADTLTGSNYQKNFLKPLTGVPGANASGVALLQDAVDVGMFGVDAAFKWMGLYAQGEYFLASAEAKNTVNTATGPLGDAGAKRKLKSSGYYVQAGYTVLPRTLEVAARYSAVDPNTTNFETATDTSAKHDQRTEISGVVNYYFAKHFLKLQAELSSQSREEKSLAAGALPTDYRKLANLIGRVQAQVIF